MFKKITNISDHVLEITGDEEFATKLKAAIENREISRKLSVLRNKKELSEAELGEKLGWSTEKVSKLEHSEDRDLSLGEILDYIQALGYKLEFKENT